MKSLSAALAFVVLSLILAREVSAPDQNGPLGRPWDLLIRTRGTPRNSLGFVLREVPDFRRMYCDKIILDKRIATGICVVDFGPGGVLEMRIGADEKLSDVLPNIKNSPIRDSKGGLQPPITVIKRRAIIGSGGGRAFLETPIEPGDFIVRGGVE